MQKTNLAPKYSMRLVDLPSECLQIVLQSLAARDLGALSVQATYLRSVAEEPHLWEPHCLARWPGADARLLYGGSWCRLHQARARMPAAFPLAADRARTITAAQRELQQQQPMQLRDGLARMAFEEVMRSIFTLGLAVTGDAALKRTPEFQALKKDVAWWLNERSQAVVGFVRAAHEEAQGMLGGHAASAFGAVDTAWRRSAIAFMQELGLLAQAHQSVVERLRRETQALDHTMLGAEEAGNGHAVQRQRVPDGVPSKHWWYFPGAVRAAA